MNSLIPVKYSSFGDLECKYSGEPDKYISMQAFIRPPEHFFQNVWYGLSWTNGINHEVELIKQYCHANRFAGVYGTTVGVMINGARRMYLGVGA